jgi:crotonobetaine/carnitine-CoA ligase
MGEDEVMVCLTLKAGADLSPVALMDYCRERMAYFMVPRYLRFLTDLPKTSTQRVQKFQLRTDGVTADTWDREKAGYQLKR